MSSPPSNCSQKSTICASGRQTPAAPTPIQSTNNIQCSQATSKYSAISALMMPPPLPTNYHHNHHHAHHGHSHHSHHHHQHHHHHTHSHLSIMDIKHFSANLANSNDATDSLLFNNCSSAPSIQTSDTKPLNTEDLIIVDEEDNHVVCKYYKF